MRRAMLAAALLVCGPPSIAALPLPDDGWASWQVETAEGAPNWCCFDWQRGPARRTACDLDGRNDGYGNASRDDTTRTVHVYARFAGGKLAKLRTLGPACMVTTRTPIRDLGSVAPDESAAWLYRQLPLSGKGLLDDTLASLSVHRGSTPTMIRIATADANPKARAQAWFWLSQTGAPQIESEIAAALRKETDSHVREQAIFALSQLHGERAAKALAAVAGDVSMPREDRKHAIFWMGQVDSPFAATYLDRLLGGK
jgi:hypothetical protein